MEFKDKITANADRLIEEGVNGDGLLAEYINAAYAGIENRLTANNENKKKRHPELALEPAQIKKQAEAELQEMLHGKDGKSGLRGALIALPGGNTGGIDMGQVSQLASAGSNVAANAASGNVIGLITSVPSLIANSFIGDYFNAAVNYFFGGDNKPKSFGESLWQVRLKRGANAVASQLQVNAEALTAELTKDPEEFVEPDAPTKPDRSAGASPAVPKKLEEPVPAENADAGIKTSDAIIPHPDFDRPNGVPPEGGPSFGPGVARNTQRGQVC